MGEGRYCIKLLPRRILMLFMGNSFKGHQMDSFVVIFLSVAIYTGLCFEHSGSYAFTADVDSVMG